MLLSIRLGGVAGTGLGAAWLKCGFLRGRPVARRVWNREKIYILAGLAMDWRIVPPVRNGISALPHTGHMGRSALANAARYTT
jgi:hypothetical protein